MAKTKRELPVAFGLRAVLIAIVIEGMATNVDGMLLETFEPPCRVCVETKRLASGALGIKPFWEDNAEELNRLIMERSAEI